MSTSPPPIPSKPNFLETMLDEFPVVDVHFAVLAPDVVVPQSMRADGRIVGVLQYGLRLTGRPIPDLLLGRDGVSATMSFSRTPHPTFVPWHAVFAIYASGTEEGFTWDADIPREDLALAALKATPHLDAKDSMVEKMENVKALIAALEDYDALNVHDDQFDLEATPVPAPKRIKRHLHLVPLSVGLDGPQEPLTESRLTVHDLRVIRGGS